MQRLDQPAVVATVRRYLSKGVRWPLALRFALRDFRGGLRGFGIFLGCIALGVAAITGVGSVSLSLKDGLARQGRAILGGDASFNLVQREASLPERAFLARQGRVSPVALMRLSTASVPKISLRIARPRLYSSWVSMPCSPVKGNR